LDLSGSVAGGLGGFRDLGALGLGLSEGDSDEARDDDSRELHFE
jgi:hypothetical protein